MLRKRTPGKIRRFDRIKFIVLLLLALLLITLLLTRGYRGELLPEAPLHHRD